MAETTIVSQLMNQAVNSPQAVLLGAAVGAAVGWWRAKTKYKNNMGMNF